MIVKGSPLDRANSYGNITKERIMIKISTPQIYQVCSMHKRDISTENCSECLKLLDTLLKKFNILNDVEM